MEALFTPIAVKVFTSVVVTLLVLSVYFAVDIYMLVTKKHFGVVNVYLVYFTRNDHSPKNDALHFRNVGYKIPLMREIYKNRILFWRVIWASIGITPEKPVLDFGPDPDDVDRMLLPVRTWFVSKRCAQAELKRANGMPFRETSYQVALVYDRSEDRRNYVLKVVLLRTEDMNNSHLYLDNPPKTEKNFPLWKKIAEAYMNNTGSFVVAQVVSS